MEKLLLLRSYSKDRTIGVIPHLAVTLERAWRGNATFVSCITPGTYVVLRDLTGKHQFYRVQDVEGRTFIEFHGGTIPTNSDGCILVGMSHDSKFNLQGSEEALKVLLDNYPDGFMLEIRSYDPMIDGVYEDLLPK